MEVEHLDKFFSGTPYILGPINGPRWHVYSSDHCDRPKLGKEQILEVAMFELDRDSMKHFYVNTYSDILDCKESKDNPEMLKKIAGQVATARSGIATILPDFDIDWQLFTPCGYSCNGLKDEYYFTIHVTPEPHCSFVSFETNVPAHDYSEIISKVLSIFRPNRFCVLLAEDSIPKTRSKIIGFEGFSSAGVTQVSVGSTRVTGTQFVKCLKDIRLNMEYDSPDSADSPSSDTDADAKGDKNDQKKKKRKKRCKKKKKKSARRFFVSL